MNGESWCPCSSFVIHNSRLPTDKLSGHVALRHPQSNENGRYERGEALTENKALSAYFQGRSNRAEIEATGFVGQPSGVLGQPPTLRRISPPMISLPRARRQR